MTQRSRSARRRRRPPAVRPGAGIGRTLGPAEVDLLWLSWCFRLTLDQVSHYQSVLSAAHERLRWRRFAGDLDLFWTALREALLQSGATDREVGLMAASAVRGTVRTLVEHAADAVASVDATLAAWPREDLIALVGKEVCTSYREELATQLQPIAEHLARTDMHVHFGLAGSVRRVDFPERRLQ